MEIAENGFASGDVRGLPPSKRFKYVGSHLESAPRVLLPAKKRVFPPPPPPEAATVSVCLPVKKRAIVAPRPELHAAAVPICLPAKKRAIVAPPPEVQAAAVPSCLPAKKRAIVAPPPEDAVPACLPAKKRAYAPPAEEVLPACLTAKKHACAPPPSDAVASTRVLAKKRVHAPAPRDAGARSAPACQPSNSRVCTAPVADKVVSTGVAAKKSIHSPAPRQDAAGSVPVCLPANKRVMPPPSVESDGARLGTAKESRPQGSNKHSGGAAINPRVANGTEGFARGKELKKPEKPINPKGIKEQVSIKPSKPRSPSKAKDLEKKAFKIANGRQIEVGTEVCKKSDKVEIEVGTEVSKKSGKVEIKVGTEVSKKSDKVEIEVGTEVRKKSDKVEIEVGTEVRKKSEKVADAKGASLKEEARNGADEVAQEREQEAAVEEDDGVLCAVCGSTDGDPSDPIVFCDGCDLMVHASCYGNPLAQAIPDGDWFCSLCSAKKSKPAARPSCCLCPAKGGAMKRTTEGQWAHISCALLVPEVFFRDPDGRDGVDCSRVPAHRFAKDCYICESNNGCALECSQPKCTLGFHVSCGLDAGLCIEYREGKGGAIVAGFCREHTELWEKQQLTGKYKIVARGQE